MALINETMYFFAGSSRLTVCLMTFVRLIITVEVKFAKKIEKFCFFVGVTFCYGTSFIFITLLLLYSEYVLKRKQIFDSFYIIIMDLVPSTAIFVVNLTILRLVKRISLDRRKLRPSSPSLAGSPIKKVAETKV